MDAPWSDARDGDEDMHGSNSNRNQTSSSCEAPVDVDAGGRQRHERASPRGVKTYIAQGRRLSGDQRRQIRHSLRRKIPCERMAHRCCYPIPPACHGMAHDEITDGIKEQRDVESKRGFVFANVRPEYDDRWTTNMGTSLSAMKKMSNSFCGTT